VKTVKMSTIKAFPNTVTQTTGGKYATWEGLQNIKSNTSASYAVTVLVKGKSQSPNRPSTVKTMNYKLNLPTGSKVSSIKVEYVHDLQPYDNKYPTIPAPTISLVNVNGTYSKKGVAPGTGLTTGSVTFTPKNTTDFSVSNLNNSKFGVDIDYPTNTSTNSGYVRLRFVRVTVEYKTPSFTVKWESPSTVEQGGQFDTTLVVSNKNLTDYHPTINVLTPAGFSLKNEPTGDGTWTKIQNRQYTWVPNLFHTKASISLGLSFDVNVTGTLPVSSTFTAEETLTGATGEKTISVVEKQTPTPVDPDEPVTPEEQTINNHVADEWNEPNPLLPAIRVRKRYPCYIGVKIDQTLVGQTDITFKAEPESSDLEILTADDDYLEWEEDDGAYESSAISNTISAENEGTIASFSYDSSDKIIYVFFGSNTIGMNPVTFTFSTEEMGTYTQTIYIETIPDAEDLTTPYATILTLTQEELNRLGDGYTYTAETILKEVTNEPYARNWGRNFRIGIFNNPILTNITHYTYTDEYGEQHDISYDSTNYDTLTISDIIDNAEYWSGSLTHENTYEELSVQFPYSEKYPLYVIITGDYPEALSMASVQFTNPCIVESEVYNSREATGNYPVPINNVVTTDGSVISIPTYESTTPVIVYDLDLDDDYGTDTEMAIRGIAVELTVDDWDTCVLSAQLKSPTGATGEWSVNLDASVLDDNNTLLLGGIGDLWNFTTQDLVDLKDWEVELTFHNILTETETSIHYDDVHIIFYVEQIETQQSYCHINGEDIRYYGAFITDIDIPSGLRTTTKYLDIDGTDTNDAYRQNIREKTITMELSIGDNCDLELATTSLRQLTQLLLNERDKYNRPIPKKIQFSFMPDVYFEYIIEDVFDNPIEISSYNVKIKLIIPSGTSYKNNSTTTNTTGHVQGLAKVPAILSIKPTGSNILIEETETGQKFNISLPTSMTDIIIIDSENRKCYQSDEANTQGTDITKYVDYNSDWFTLHGKYTFTSTNAYIRSVNYTERW